MQEIRYSTIYNKPFLNASEYCGVLSVCVSTLNLATVAHRHRVQRGYSSWYEVAENARSLSEIAQLTNQEFAYNY